MHVSHCLSLAIAFLIRQQPVKFSKPAETARHRKPRARNRREAELGREPQHVGGGTAGDLDQRICHVGAGAARNHQAAKARVSRRHLGKRPFGRDPVRVRLAVSG